MDKELINKAWACLPREFKEEVKRKWEDTLSDSPAEEELEKLFGRHNLTSDAEGEDEMLCVPRSKVQELYSSYCTERDEEEPGSNRSSLGGRIVMLQELFGSKCLPDEEQPKQKDCDNPLADKEGCKWRNNGKCAFGSACYFEPLNPQEPKPAEPKFKVGDIASYVCSPTLKHKCTITEAIKNEHSGKWEYNVMFEWGKPGRWIPESDLEPYTEPEEPTCTDTCTDDCPSQTVNLSQKIANCDKCNNLRLHIAAMAMQGILGNADRMKSCEQIAMSEPYEDLPAVVARNAVRYANALIAECSKDTTAG